MIQHSRTRSVLATLVATSCLVLLYVVVTTVVAYSMIVSSVDDLGLKPGGDLGFGQPGDRLYIQWSLIPVTPLIGAQAAAVVWRRWWSLVLGALAAIAAALYHAWQVGLFVGLRLWGDDSPVTWADINGGISTGVITAVLDIALLVASVALLQAFRRLVRSLSARSEDPSA